MEYLQNPLIQWIYNQSHTPHRTQWCPQQDTELGTNRWLLSHAALLSISSVLLVSAVGGHEQTIPPPQLPCASIPPLHTYITLRLTPLILITVLLRRLKSSTLKTHINDISNIGSTCLNNTRKWSFRLMGADKNQLTFPSCLTEYNVVVG